MPRPKGKSSRSIACQTDTVFLTEEQVESILKKALSRLEKEIDNLNIEVKDLTSTNEKLTKDSDALNHLQQATEVEFEHLEEKCKTTVEDMSKLQKKVGDLERTNCYISKRLCEKESVTKQLTSTVDQLEQDKKMNSIRIAGFPEEDDEHVHKKVLDTTKKLKLPKQVQDEDLQSASRMGRPRPNKSRDILVTFKRWEIRDMVYQNKMSIPRDENQPTFINEDLTLQRGKLFYQARLKKKAGKLYTAWTQNGTVMVKIDVDATPCAVSTYAELKELFSIEVTNSGSELSDIDEEWMLSESSSLEY